MNRGGEDQQTKGEEKWEGRNGEKKKRQRSIRQWSWEKNEMQSSTREKPVQDYGFHIDRETFRTEGGGDSKVINSTIKRCVKEAGSLFNTPLGLDKPLVLLMGILHDA
jgi:hypothetical protein